MALLFISEYAEPQAVAGHQPQIVSEPPLAEQTVAIGAEADSAVLNAATRIVRLHADATCSVLFGVTPTAAVTNKRLAGGSTEYFRVRAGDRISVISNS